MKAISFLFVLLTGCATEYKKDPVKATFHGKDSLYRQCYQESDSYMGRTTKENRKIDVELLVGTNGEVEKSTFVKSDFKDPNFHTCLKGVFKFLRFENIKAPLEVHEQITFDARL